jgi:ribosomal protein S18 acetylase RimI-like enzyme
MEGPRPARGAPSDELLELVAWIRRELVARNESPTGAWVEETVRDLLSGAKDGAYYPIESGGALGFRADRGDDSFGHVHVGPGPEPVERAARLTDRLFDARPATAHALSIGFTGLTTEDEIRLRDRLLQRPGTIWIQRYAMERALGPEDDPELPGPPDGLAVVPVRDVTIEALADLDRRAFEGTTDELLIGSQPAEYRRILEALLGGEMGRFLDEASTALYRPDPPALLGAILTCERSARRAVFLDFMVDPAARGRGYGRFLLRWGFRALRALGHERVGLWVTGTNAAARRLYDDVGFRVTHTAAIYRWDAADSSPQPHSAA